MSEHCVTRPLRCLVRAPERDTSRHNHHARPPHANTIHNSTRAGLGRKMATQGWTSTCRHGKRRGEQNHKPPALLTRDLALPFVQFRHTHLSVALHRKEVHCRNAVAIDVLKPRNSLCRDTDARNLAGPDVHAGFSAYSQGTASTQRIDLATPAATDDGEDHLLWTAMKQRKHNTCTTLDQSALLRKSH